MQPWMQVYDPAGNLWLSSLIAAIPIIFFFVALALLKMKGHVAGTITVLLAIAVAILFYKMPVAAALMAGVQGFLYGLWPIAWIIIGSMICSQPCRRVEIVPSWSKIAWRSGRPAGRGRASSIAVPGA